MVVLFTIFLKASLIYPRTPILRVFCALTFGKSEKELHVPCNPLKMFSLLLLSSFIIQGLFAATEYDSDGWARVGEEWYIVSDDQMNWYEAQEVRVCTLILFP